MGQTYDQLDEAERIKIGRLRGAGLSKAEIARQMKRHPSTIGREIRRNASRWGTYQPLAAERRAHSRRHAHRLSKIRRSSQLQDHIRDYLAMGQSPEQIAGRLEHTTSSLSISHESIYRFIHSWAGRQERLHKYLAQGKSRRGRRARLGQSKPLILNRVSIRDRPLIIKSELPFGHWEADLMSFGRRDTTLVLTEQRSRYILAVRQFGKHSRTTAASLKRLLRRLPENAKASITFDNGGEFARHASLGIDTYFCDAHSPWQKGAVENAIGRLRRDLPPKTRHKDHSHAQFRFILASHNNRPRKCLDFKTPAEIFNENLRCT